MNGADVVVLNVRHREASPSNNHPHISHFAWELLDTQRFIQPLLLFLLLLVPPQVDRHYIIPGRHGYTHSLLIKSSTFDWTGTHGKETRTLADQWVATQRLLCPFPTIHSLTSISCEYLLCDYIPSLPPRHCSLTATTSIYLRHHFSSGSRISKASFRKSLQSVLTITG